MTLLFVGNKLNQCVIFNLINFNKSFAIKISNLVLGNPFTYMFKVHTGIYANFFFFFFF